MLPKMSPFEEHVWNHVKNRKTPVTSNQIAKRFIVSKSHASAALTFLVSSNLLDVLKMGNITMYRAKHEEKSTVHG